MISGATGIDHALLLVAADDGPMPQTREHLAVLSLLGITSGAVVVTKTDRVDAARVDDVAMQAAALLAGTPLAGADVQAAFRLAIDRVFTLDGVGTVVTGTVHGGRVQVGDELQLVPGERRVRVRSRHAQNVAASEAGAGTRCALALAGVERQQVERGQWLVAPWAALAGDRADATLTLWAADPDTPHLLATPFFRAAAAAVMEIPVEGYYTARSVRLLVPGVADALRAGAHPKTIGESMREAADHGARFYAGSDALAAAGLADTPLIAECSGRGGAVQFAARAADLRWRALVF